MLSAQDNEAAARSRRGAQCYSSGSQSNGGLMRISPLCVWTSKLSMEELKSAVHEETKLTHSNKTALDVSVVYVYTIQHLLNNKGDSQGAYEKAKEMIQHLNNSELSQWIKELESDKLPEATDKIGWVKIALLYSLHYLRDKKSYYDAMKDMLSKGGDTDTNCCIVGGMLGALYGIECVPKKYVEKLFSDEERAYERASFLLPSVVFEEMFAKLVEHRPETLNMENHSGLTSYKALSKITENELEKNETDKGNEKKSTKEAGENITNKTQAS